MSSCRAAVSAVQEDFIWQIVAPLNGAPNAVSFESTNYPGWFLSVATASGVENGRLGIVQQQSTAAYNAASSFQVVPGLADPSQYSFVAFGSFAGYYIAASSQQIGGCSVCRHQHRF